MPTTARAYAEGARERKGRELYRRCVGVARVVQIVQRRRARAVRVGGMHLALEYLWRHAVRRQPELVERGRSMTDRAALAAEPLFGYLVAQLHMEHVARDQLRSLFPRRILL